MARLGDIDDGITKCLGDMKASLQVSGLELQRATYDEMQRANAAILAKIESLGGAEVSHVAFGLVLSSSVQRGGGSRLESFGERWFDVFGMF